MTNLLAIDIGNTSTSYGIFKNGRLQRHFHASGDVIPKNRLFSRIKSVDIKSYKVIISSVNPKKIQKLVKYIKSKIPSKNLLILGVDNSPKIRHKYRKIGQLGRDRLTNIYGGLHFYPTPLLIINFGTATTVDLVSGKDVYEGGLIIPGIETAWRALQERAALLPKALIIKGKNSLVGRNTVDCMQAGILQGFGAMVDGLIERFQAEYGRNLFVLASGGLAKKIKPYVKRKIKVDQTHTLKSLALIYRNYSKTDGISTKN